ACRLLAALPPLLRRRVEAGERRGPQFRVQDVILTRRLRWQLRIEPSDNPERGLAYANGGELQSGQEDSDLLCGALKSHLAQGFAVHAPKDEEEVIVTVFIRLVPLMASTK